MPRSPTELLVLHEVDTIGHQSWYKPNLDAPLNTRLRAVRRLCEQGVLLAETFIGGENVDALWLWVARPEHFRLPYFAKFRGERLWSGTK